MAYSWTDYKGMLLITPQATGTAGSGVSRNFSGLIDAVDNLSGLISATGNSILLNQISAHQTGVGVLSFQSGSFLNNLRVGIPANPTGHLQVTGQMVIGNSSRINFSFFMFTSFC